MGPRSEPNLETSLSYSRATLTEEDLTFPVFTGKVTPLSQENNEDDEVGSATLQFYDVPLEGTTSNLEEEKRAKGKSLELYSAPLGSASQETKADYEREIIKDPLLKGLKQLILFAILAYDNNKYKTMAPIRDYREAHILRVLMCLGYPDQLNSLAINPTILNFLLKDTSIIDKNDVIAKLENYGKHSNCQELIQALKNIPNQTRWHHGKEFVNLMDDVFELSKNTKLIEVFSRLNIQVIDVIKHFELTLGVVNENVESRQHRSLSNLYNTHNIDEDLYYGFVESLHLEMAISLVNILATNDFLENSDHIFEILETLKMPFRKAKEELLLDEELERKSEDRITVLKKKISDICLPKNLSSLKKNLKDAADKNHDQVFMLAGQFRFFKEENFFKAALSALTQKNTPG